jgi:Mg2+ and Co2+ transporter CorA
LIAQRDNVVSITLSKEALSDSKAMKTLSILTIIFLPGTFVATIFSSGMVHFKDSVHEARIFIAVVIPVTIVFLTAYVLWLILWPRVKARLESHDEHDLTAKGI